MLMVINCRHEKLRCRYSDIAEGERGNHCVQAHSTDELDEWKTRYQWRQMKKQMARERQLYTYMDTLVDDIAAATAAATARHAPVVCVTG